MKNSKKLMSLVVASLAIAGGYNRLCLQLRLLKT